MKNKKVKGIKIVNIFAPAAFLIFVLYVVIVVCTVLINSVTSKTIYELNRTSDCVGYISDLQSRNSKMFQTSYSFVQKPILTEPTYTINIKPIEEYVNELLIEEKTPEYILDKIEQYDIDDDAMELINEAIEGINTLNQMQAHAIYLIAASIENDTNVNTSNEYYSFLELLEYIPEYELSNEERALPDAAKKGMATRLLGSDYNILNGDTTNKLKNANIEIKQQANNKQNELIKQFKMLRGLLWLTLVLILLANFACLFIVVFMLVIPIVRFARRIDENERLDETSGLYEAKRLAVAYNELLDRHKEFENELREVAEEDSLTGLPNRYSYNSFLNNPIIEDKSVCIFVFDINNLKYVNDTFGHDKGDELIKNASECIKSCFLINENMHCYRIGGDEFVSIVENIKEEDINKLIDEFKIKQEANNISIAVGYSYVDNINNVGYEKLFIKADKMMYDNKKEMKKEL